MPKEMQNNSHSDNRCIITATSNETNDVIFISYITLHIFIIYIIFTALVKYISRLIYPWSQESHGFISP